MKYIPNKKKHSPDHCLLSKLTLIVEFGVVMIIIFDINLYDDDDT